MWRTTGKPTAVFISKCFIFRLKLSCCFDLQWLIFLGHPFLLFVSHSNSITFRDLEMMICVVYVTSTVRLADPIIETIFCIL